MSKKAMISVQIPSEIYVCVEEYAKAQKVSVDVLVAQTVFDAFKGNLLQRGIKPPMQTGNKERK